MKLCRVFPRFRVTFTLAIGSFPRYLYSSSRYHTSRVENREFSSDHCNFWSALAPQRGEIQNVEIACRDLSKTTHSLRLGQIRAERNLPTYLFTSEAFPLPYIHISILGTFFFLVLRKPSKHIPQLIDRRGQHPRDRLIRRLIRRGGVAARGDEHLCAFEALGHGLRITL